jgi:hypothetical protein
MWFLERNSNIIGLMQVGKRILVFVVYFGEFPNYFDLTLDSMKRNGEIDWLFVTDQNIDDIPSNVKLNRISFEKFREFVQASFDFQISLNDPYKICDFRPAFGKIFRDTLGDYDFWGHCDLDVIFGNILESIPARAWTFDKILIKGALGFYRNTKRTNELYAVDHADTLDSRKAFSSEENLYFDEWHGVIQKFLREGIQFWNDDTVYFDIDKNSFRIKTVDHMRIRPKFVPDGRILMFDKLLDEQVQGAYIHLQKRRMFFSKTMIKYEPYEIRFNHFVEFGHNYFRIDYMIIGAFHFLYLRFRALKKRYLQSLLKNR